MRDDESSLARGSARFDERAPGASPMVLLQKLLQAALRSRYVPSRAAYHREKPAVARGVGGCLMRLLLVVVVLFIALAAAAFMFGRAMLEGY
jgi:hypothetical protein